MKIGNNGNLALGPFDESTPCLMIVLMNCQTKLRINPLTAVKSVAILERGKWCSGDPLRSLCPRSSCLEEIGGLGIPLRFLWPTLHCRRVAGVSPLLSIGWWYLSLVSPKRHCYRVRAADKGWRVYPLDPRPDAVGSGCTPGKRHAWCLPDDRHTAYLVGLRGGWRHARMKVFTRTYGSEYAVPW
ncbi:uncharacterized protein TNCV_1710131 [Trichonephila clavipes]|nr:uncharacterized protein TNCV_1710131 [Trichonephila clavipes]